MSDEQDWGDLHRIQHDGVPLVAPKLGGHIIRWAVDEISALRHRIQAEASAHERGRAEAFREAADVAQSYEEGLGVPGTVRRDDPGDAYLTGVADAAQAIADAIRSLSQKEKG